MTRARGRSTVVRGVGSSPGHSRRRTAASRPGRSGWPGEESRARRQTRHAAGPALDLDQEKAHWAQHQEVNLVDAAVEGDKLEVGPGPVRLVVGEAVADEVEGVPLPGVSRFGDGDPALPRVAHGTAPSSP